MKQSIHSDPPVTLALIEETAKKMFEVSVRAFARAEGLPDSVSIKTLQMGTKTGKEAWMALADWHLSELRKAKTKS